MIKIIISVLRFVSLNTESQMRIKNIVIHANNHRNKQKKNTKKPTHTHTTIGEILTNRQNIFSDE